MRLASVARWASPATAASGRKREQAMAQRSKKPSRRTARRLFREPQEGRSHNLEAGRFKSFLRNQKETASKRTLFSFCFGRCAEPTENGAPAKRSFAGKRSSRGAYSKAAARRLCHAAKRAATRPCSASYKKHLSGASFFASKAERGPRPRICAIEETDVLW